MRDQLDDGIWWGSDHNDLGMLGRLCNGAHHCLGEILSRALAVLAD